MVCSTAFTALGRAQAAALGFAALPMLVIPHPFGTRSREEIRAIAEQCVLQLIARATAEGQPGAGAER
jgi:hypothetical protein